MRISNPGGFDNSTREPSPGAREFGGRSSPGRGFDRVGHDDYENPVPTLAFMAVHSKNIFALHAPIEVHAYMNPLHSIAIFNMY